LQESGETGNLQLRVSLIDLSCGLFVVIIDIQMNAHMAQILSVLYGNKKKHLTLIDHRIFKLSGAFWFNIQMLEPVQNFKKKKFTYMGFDRRICCCHYSSQSSIAHLLV